MRDDGHLGRIDDRVRLPRRPVPQVADGDGAAGHLGTAAGRPNGRAQRDHGTFRHGLGQVSLVDVIASAGATSPPRRKAIALPTCTPGPAAKAVSRSSGHSATAASTQPVPRRFTSTTSQQPIIHRVRSFSARATRWLGEVDRRGQIVVWDLPLRPGHRGADNGAHVWRRCGCVPGAGSLPGPQVWRRPPRSTLAALRVGRDARCLDIEAVMAPSARGGDPRARYPGQAFAARRPARVCCAAPRSR
jgi:hypothetical protein